MFALILIGLPAVTLGTTLREVDLPQVVSTDALDRSLPSLVIDKKGTITVWAGAGDDANQAPQKDPTKALSALLKESQGTSAALFFDEEAPGEAIANALVIADKAGASSFSLAVHGMRAVRAPRPPACEQSDELDDRCAEVRYSLSSEGLHVSAVDVDVGVEGCEPPSASTAQKKGERAKWSGKPLLGSDGKCPTLSSSSIGDVKATQRAIVQKIGDCSRARVVVGPGALGKDVVALTKALREAGVDAVTLMPNKKPEKVEKICSGAVPMTALDSGMPAAAKKLKVDGPITPAEVKAALRAHDAAMKKCFEDVFPEKGAKGGTLVLSFVVDPNGAVVSATPARGGDLQSPEVEACALAQVRATTFPKPKQPLPTSVLLPLVFGAH